MARKLTRGVAFTLLLVVAWLFAAPAPIEPVAWEPPPPTPLEGPYAPNDRLAGVEWWARQLVGPEAMYVDGAGRLITGLKDGRIVALTPGNDTPTELADTHGRPLAIAPHPDGRIIICDAFRGLLALSGDGVIEVLASEQGGVPFRFVDDLAITKAGVIYFTDASARHSIDRFTDDLLEHQRTGRVLKFDPQTRATTLVAGDFNFANGVALGPDEAFLVVAETGAYRLWRLWLSGEKAGQRELFTDALPGFPDNVRFSPARGVFWVAIGSPRNPLVDALAPLPFLRSLVSKLPKAVQPRPARHAFVVGVDVNGRVVEVLQHRAPDSYSPIASALEHDGWLYLGSFAREGVARLKLDPVPKQP
ncbi:MAG: SMP-30/gluconolactonase/LRE family protein [Myxococcaceae bacterium]|jgi:sugar lactone lactonase YvrE|nr:SMP-30/gluconolactonase/LRE family protein [Myxococcaceae bacterium]